MNSTPPVNDDPTEPNLFDPAPFTRGTPHTPRKATPKPPPEVTPVRVDAGRRWTIVAIKQPGIVHYRSSSGALGDRTVCGVFGYQMSFAAGETVSGCSRCLAAGAPSEAA